MRRTVTSETLDDYINGRDGLLKEIGDLDISGQRSDSDISYFRWEIEFHEDTDATRIREEGFDEIQIMFNLNRDIEWSVEDPKDGSCCQKVFMHKGDLCIYRSNDRISSMNYRSGVKFRFKSIQMKTERFMELLDTHFTPEEAELIKKAVLDDVRTTKITPEMYRVLSEIDSADRYKEFKRVLMDSKMIELTALVLYAIIHDDKDNKKKGVVVSREEARALDELRETIQLKPYKDYDATMVAENLRMSVSKLNRAFRSVYGTSLHAYVQEMRLEHAARLLLDGYNVTESATRSGYNNMSYFARAFRERYNVRPKRFRERKVSEKEL